VSRRRYQRGSVFPNKTKTLWLGMYTEYVLDEHGIERRERKQVTLSPMKITDADGERKVTKREAQKLLQPYVDRVNAALSAPIRERKSATFEAFAAIWERDYLSQSKPSTQSGAKSYLKRLNAAFGKKDIRQIDAGDMQRLVARMTAEGLNPKTIRNVWGVASLIWNAALAQKYVDALLPKPKLPRKLKKKPRFFTLSEVGKIIAASEGEQRAFYWLLAECGLRAGEVAGLKLTDIDGDKLTVNQSVWNGSEQAPKTENAVRTLSLSPQLVSLLWEQLARQKAKGREFLFSSSTGSPLDMNAFRKRKLKPLLTSLEIPPDEGKAFHAFRHFNVSLLDTLRVPLKVIQERIGHALTGSFTLDVYGSVLDWSGNVDAANKAAAAIAEAVEKAEQEQKQKAEQTPFVSLTASNENGLGA
jgi:integrase